MTLLARIDAVQPAIVQALLRAGCSIMFLHAVGGGCPDLAVGRAGRTYLLEVKAPRPKGHAPLTPPQEAWHASWRGHVAIVTTPEEALLAVGLLAA